MNSCDEKFWVEQTVMCRPNILKNRTSVLTFEEDFGGFGGGAHVVAVIVYQLR